MCVYRKGVMRTEYFFTTQRTTLSEVLEIVIEKREELYVLAHDQVPPKNGEIALWPNTRVVKCKHVCFTKTK